MQKTNNELLEITDRTHHHRWCRLMSNKRW